MRIIFSCTVHHSQLRGWIASLKGSFSILEFPRLFVTLSGTPNLQVRVPKQTISMEFFGDLCMYCVLMIYPLCCGGGVSITSINRETNIDEIIEEVPTGEDESGGGARATAETGI